MEGTSPIIYLDNNSTTKVDPRVLEEMLPYFTEIYSNASSSHAFGSKANQAIKTARENISNFIGAKPNELIFTSGATEAINLAIKGVAQSYSYKGKHIITVATEHRAVLDVCKHLEHTGFDISYLPVDNEGLLDIQLLTDTIKEDTILISVMLVNNETGVIQDVKRIGEVAKSKGIVMLTDATQGVGKIEVNVDDLNVDLLAFSAHKFYGPKGIGGLYVRNKTKATPLIHGGGHENNLRSGTLNVPGIVGMSKAIEIAQKEMKIDSIKISKLRNYLEEELLKVQGAFINGSILNRLYNVTNIYIPLIEATVFIGKNKSIAISNGSACASAVMEPSHVLKAMGVSESNASNSFRISYGKYNLESDTQVFLTALTKALN